jgi:choline dehydrogenase
LQRPTPVAQALFGAAGKLGLRAGADGFDYNAAERRENVVFGYQATLYPDGGRAGPAETYLRPALTRPNLTVLDRTLIRRVTVRAGRATGVEYVRDGRAGSVRAAREIVLCAGAFGSPHLLLLSGIGPARQLAGHAIAVVSDVPGVGAALKDHLILPVAYLSARAADPGAGLIAETGFFLRTAGQRPEEPPGLQFAFGGLKFVPPELDRTGPGFSFAAILAQPCSRGSVTLASADPARPPLVDPGYLTADSDLEALRDGAQLCRELASTPQLRPFAAQELAPGPQVRTRAELDTYIRTYAGTQWHPAGTCRMGATQDPEAVVDPRLRVRGVAGLRVADASIMPRIVAGNTNATCVAIGEKAAELIAADAERG